MLCRCSSSCGQATQELIYLAHGWASTASSLASLPTNHGKAASVEGSRHWPHRRSLHLSFLLQRTSHHLQAISCGQGLPSLLSYLAHGETWWSHCSSEDWASRIRARFFPDTGACSTDLTVRCLPFQQQSCMSIQLCLI